MILLYTLLLLALGVVKWLIARRAASLERKYTRAATLVLKLVSDANVKPGNASKFDVATNAKHLLEIGVLASRRDRLEAKCIAWRGWADKAAGALSALRTWKGKKLPYTVGAIDVWLVLYAIDRFGLGDAVS